MNQIFSITGKITGIEEKLNKNNEPFYKVSIEYGDRTYTINCNDKPGSVGEEVTIPYTETEFTSQQDGKTYKTKWAVKEGQAPKQSRPVTQSNETMVLLSMNRKLDEILGLLRGNPQPPTSASVPLDAPVSDDEIDVNSIPF